MILRAGRADLHQRLGEAAKEAAAVGIETTEELWKLLREARDAVLKCPVEGCAYCYTVEQQEATDPRPPADTSWTKFEQVKEERP